MKPRIILTRPIPKAGLDLLVGRGQYDIVLHQENKIPSADELARYSHSADAIISLLTEKFTPEIIGQAGERLKIIANYAVGFDNIDLAAATAKGIAVTNTPDVMTQTVAEHAVALMLAASRRLLEGDRYIRAGKYKQWEPELLLGPELFGKTLGIIGTGRIGAVMAQICYHGLGMKIIYHDIEKNLDLERATHAYQTSVNHLLETADVVSLHVPLLPTTKHMIDATALRQMKKNAILINTSRGPIVKEKALIAALKNHDIFAAGLDVFEFEPKVASALKELPNIVMTPHCASATHEARNAMAVMAAENVIAALSGKLPPNLVNKELADKFREGTPGS
jgi:lactate dehydrogenase-like 2-hydroxyacid dehydrogenase